MTDAEFQTWLEESVKGLTPNELRAEFEALGCEFEEPSFTSVLHDHWVSGSMIKVPFNGPCWTFVSTCPSVALVGSCSDEWRDAFSEGIRGKVSLKPTEDVIDSRAGWISQESDELALVA